MVDLQQLKSYNHISRCILNVIDVFSKFVWRIPIKDRTGKTITNTFQSIIKTSKRKPNKLWVDNGSEFYNNVFKKLLVENEIKMYSTFNEGKVGIQHTNPTTYIIKDYNNEIIEGSFYENELQKTDQDFYRIDKVIKKDYKKKLALVSWKGYPKEFNSWIPLNDVE